MGRNGCLKWMGLLVLGSFLFGCATDKQLSRDALKPIGSMTAAQYKSPPLLMPTIGSKVVGATGVLFGAIGGGLGGAAQYQMMEGNGRDLQERCKLPDYADLTFKQLVQRIPSEVPGWPQMTVKAEPVVNADELKNIYVLLLSTKMLQVEDGEGLSAWTAAQLRDPQGNVLWEKNVKYKTKDLKRQCELDALEADQAKLLHEEYDFAIANTVSTIIKDLNAPAGAAN